MNFREFQDDEELHELIKKVVSFRGKIRKVKTAGKKGRLFQGNRKRSRTGKEKKNLRVGLIKRKKSLRKISKGIKNRSIKQGVRGRKIRAKRKITDFRSK